jgi:pilus assembly protein Flp/PilA
MRHAREWIGFNARACDSWILAAYVQVRCFSEAALGESGQDLVEYALVASLISLAAIVSMKSVATAISTAFTHIGSKVASYTT